MFNVHLKYNVFVPVQSTHVIITFMCKMFMYFSHYNAIVQSYYLLTLLWPRQATYSLGWHVKYIVFSLFCMIP